MPIKGHAAQHMRSHCNGNAVPQFHWNENKRCAANKLNRICLFICSVCGTETECRVANWIHLQHSFSNIHKRKSGKENFKQWIFCAFNLNKFNRKFNLIYVCLFQLFFSLFIQYSYNTQTHTHARSLAFKRSFLICSMKTLSNKSTRGKFILKPFSMCIYWASFTHI